jgi:riboflavin-specific deaminase-like protein
MGRPRVTLSYAQSLDGRIATRSGQSQWISGAGTLELAQELRRDNDAILVGIGTVLRDDPLLTCRLPGCSSPVRVILDSRLRLPEDGRIARTADRYATVVFSLAPDAAKVERLRRLGVHVIAAEPGEDGWVALAPALEALSARGIGTLFVEGGSSVITAFLRSGLVDRLLVVTAPLVIGTGVSAVADLGIDDLARALRFRPVRLEQRGEDVVWDLEPVAHG